LARVWKVFPGKGNFPFQRGNLGWLIGLIGLGKASFQVGAVYPNSYWGKVGEGKAFNNLVVIKPGRSFIYQPKEPGETLGKSPKGGLATSFVGGLCGQLRLCSLLLKKLGGIGVSN